jgi:hypothetical protein
MAIGMAATAVHAAYVECICLSDPACSSAVCFADPFCCSVHWDSICDGEAFTLGALPVVTQTYTITGPGTGTPWGWEIQLSCGATYIFNSVSNGLISNGTASALAADFANSINAQSSTPAFLNASAGSSGPNGTLTINQAATQPFTLCVSTSGTQNCCLTNSATLCVFNPTISLAPSGKDCNGNEIDDAFDIFDGSSEDADQNGVPDECEKSGVFGDINGDRFVNGADLGLLLAAWESFDPESDLDDSGMVDASDLGLLLAAWTG